MLPSLKQLREAAGGLPNLTDEEILSATYPAYQQYYGSVDDFAKAVGYEGAGRGMASSRISAGVDNYQAGLLGLGGAASRAVGLDGAADWFDRRRDANEQAAGYATQRARDLGAVDDWREVDGVGSALNYVGGLAAQSLPYLGEAAVGGLAARGLATGARAALRGATTAEEAAAAGRRLGAIQTGGAVAASYPSAVGDILGNQREAGGEDLGSALLGGVPYAALNAFGVEGLAARGFRPLAAGQGGLARRTATGAGVTALGEGLGETGQEMANQYFGRMAVDPNETLFSDEAQTRYLDSFVGGAALGGLFGGVGGIRRPRTVDEGQFDMTRREDQGDPLQLGFSPLAGTPVVFPDGSVALNSEQELQRRYGMAPEPTTIPNMDMGEGVAETQQVGNTTTKSATPKAPVISQFDEIDQGLADVGIPLASGKKTREKQRAFYQDAVATGIPLDSDLLTPYWTAVSQNRFGDKTKVLLQNAIVQSKKDAANVSTPSAPVGQPVAGSVGRSAAPVGGVGNRGSVPDVVQPDGGNAGNTQPASGQAAPVADAGVQRAAPVGENTSILAGANPATPPAAQRAAAPAPAADPFQVTEGVPDLDYDEDQNRLEIARLTGQGAVAEALEQEAAGQRVDRDTATSDDAERILAKWFEGSPTPERDRQIFDAWLTATRPAGKGVKGKINAAIGKDFNVGESRVGQLTNLKQLVETGKALGYSEEQVYEAFGLEPPNAKAVDPKANANPEAAALKRAVEDLGKRIEKAKGAEKIELEAQRKELRDVLAGMKESASEQERGQITAALKAAGFTVDENDTGGWRMDDSREWQKESSSGNQEGDILLRFAKQIEDLRAAIETLESQGLDNAATELGEITEKVLTELQAAKAALEASKATPAAPKREVSADLAAAKQKFKDVGRDVTKMEPEELRMLRGEAERFKNKELLAKIDAQLGAAPAAEETAAPAAEEAAPQAEAPTAEPQASTAMVPQDSGQKLWESLRERMPALVTYEELTANERGYLTELADRTNGKPVIKNELGLQELMGRTAQTRIANEADVIDVEARVIEETVGKQVAALPAPRVQRLEKHYGLKAGSKEFLEKVKEDVVRYATEGAEAVAAAIRDIIKAIHTGVLSVAMIFNPNFVTPPQVVILDEQVMTQTREVRAEVPADAEARMSEGAKEAYSVLYPSIKNQLQSQDKLMVVVDKPSARMFVFKPDGSLLLDKKVLLGAAKGDLYKGNNDVKANRITPAGLFTMGLRDAARGGSEAKTAGGYDFNKVFVLDKAIEGEYSVTLFHSVWTKEADAKQRLNALKNDSAADSRYSFGCINVDKETYGQLVENHLSQMDGAALFIVPESSADTAEFLKGATAQNKSGADGLTRTTFTPATETTTTRTTVPNATGPTRLAGAFGREQEGRASDAPPFMRQSRRRQRAADQFGNQFESVEASLDELTGHYPSVNVAINRLRDMGMGNTLDAVQSWQVTLDPVNWDAIYTIMDGKPTVVLSHDSMKIREIGIISVMHEVAHAIDGVQDGGKFSSDREMKVQLVNGMPMAMRPGTAMDEILNHFEDYDSGLSQLLQYPLDMSDPENRKMSARELREEVFAQVWAFSNTFGGMDWLRDNLPVTAAFMERVNAEVQQTNYGQAGAQQGAQPGQVQDGSAGQGSVLRASRSKAVPAGAQKQVEGLTKVLKVAKDAALNAIVFSEDLFKRAASMGIDAAMDMDRIYRERSALTGNIEREVTRIENLFNRIPAAFKGTGPNSANRFLYDSTREGKWGFAPKWRGADASKVTIDAGMANRFKALPKEAQEWVRSVLEHGDKMLKLKKDTLIESTNNEYDALIADARKRGENDKATKLEADKAASLRQFQRLFTVNEFKPYAPMRRFGNWVVTAKSQEYMDAVTAGDRAKVAELEKDPDHYHVSFAESYASALELQRELKKEGHFASVPDPREKEKSRLDMYGGLMSAFNQLRENIESELGGATDPSEIKALRAARETVIEMYLQSLAENSARKAEMRRRGVAGEIDMLRSFSTQGRADAHFLAASKFNPQTSQAVVKMRQQKNAPGNETEKSMAFNEVMARHEQSMKYEDGGWFDVANKASRVTSIWMLATSPMYYLQNLTQPFMLSLPFMAGRHDYTAAAGQLLRSYFQLGALLKSAKLGEGFDFTKVSNDKDEQAMVLKLVDRGRIDIGMDTELGRVKLEGDGVASKAVNRGDQILRSLSQKVEAINRVSTALAAYRLERKNGASPEAALEYADQVISQTHGDYTRINAPRAFNTPVGKVALQFRKFQLIQLTLLAKLVHNSFKGASPEERAAARKILTFTMAHTGVLAGVVGIPGFAAAAFVINKLADAFGDDDEPYNFENELRKMLGGGDLAQAVMRGAPNLVGTDLSGKLGMGNALSILPYTEFDATREGFNAIATGLTLGATGGLGARVFQALGDMKDGDYYRGLMGLAPKGISDAMRAFVEANRGETNRKGDVLVSADEISNWESFAKLIGWPTSAQSERRFDRQVAYDNKEAFENKASKLKNEYSRAVRENDADGRRAAIEKWQRLQTSRREAGFQAQPLSALMKAPQEQAKRERNTSGGVQFDKRNRQFVMEQTQ